MPPLPAFEPAQFSLNDAQSYIEGGDPVEPAGEVAEAAEVLAEQAGETPVSTEAPDEELESFLEILAEPQAAFEAPLDDTQVFADIFADEPEIACDDLPEESAAVLEVVAEEPEPFLDSEPQEPQTFVEALPDEPETADDLTAESETIEVQTEQAAEGASEPTQINVETVETVEAAAVEPEPEPKTSTSEIAGRVVEAMLKTISTAIYSKPSSAERAAFLREIAELTGQEANRVDPLRLDAGMPAVLGAEIAPPGILPAPEPMAEILASRIGPAAALLKAKPDQPDPFAQNLTHSRLAEPRPVETVDADEGSGELALTLLDMMSGGSGTALPHERTLAADTLLRILPRIPVKQLLAVVERVAIMETPPPLLVAKLIRDSRHDVVAPLLERCSNISDQDLMNAAPDGDAPKLRMIARRRILSTVLSDHLISTGEPGVVLTLIRNPGAALSHSAFFRLAEFASEHHGLLAPLATRADLPPPVAFELFWHVPQELRRFIFSRFLTDSETLNKILRITLATYSGDDGEPSNDVKFPPRETIDAAITQAAAFRLDDASQQFSEMGSISKDTALRILSDREGEPFTVLMKALGYPRTKFEEALARLSHADAGILRPDRSAEELQAIFDGLSFNKARILLTYWDWYVRKSGPYAPHN